jgi:PKD repeat protein
MRTRIFFVAILILTVVGKMDAQQNLLTRRPTPCATMEQDSINRLKFPQRGTLEEFEINLEQRISQLKKLNASGRTQSTILNIPIIVHVVNNGEAVGTGMNISQAQIQAQIAVLNEDYRKKAGTPGFNTNPVGADIEIEFCLSPVDASGNPMAEPGIHRYNGGQADWSRDEIENKLKPQTFWNPNLFYNIWTVRFAASDANILGYAQFPDQSGLSGLQEKGGPASTDGVVIRYNSFGSVDKGTFPVMQAPYNKGRTLSHETGHWLGLRHIWGDGVCADDFVADTPTSDGPSSGCPIGKIACGGGVTMPQNYMDYSEDACMNIFTQGQKLRMRAVMDICPRRKSLLQANLCSPIVAAVPTPNFTVDKLDCILLGSEVNFTDLSSNFPTEWHWEFEGGDPGVSTERNPKVIYNTPGTFKVSLTAANSKGTSAPLVIDNYITISEQGLCTDFTNFLSNYTRSVLPLSNFGPYTGFLTGHNSINSPAFSEFFLNNCGYKYISGAAIRFDQLTAAQEDAKIYITVWNARGPQSSPGSVIERKEVLIKQIKEDIANHRPTDITFDRETPVFSRPFHVGVEISYSENYKIAVVSSANGEGSNATSWIKESTGVWRPFTIEFGANIAMDIKAHVGANPSVQVAASKQLIYPGEQVTLNGRGASIFIWNASDGTIHNVPGPQLVVNPFTTTTYATSGSGLDLCNATASTTIYIRQEGIVETESDPLTTGLTVFPNPGKDNLTLEYEDAYRGEVVLVLQSVISEDIGTPYTFRKTENKFSKTIDTSTFKPGMYMLQLKASGKSVTRKWVKH